MTVKELKRILNNIDDDATIVLQIEDKEEKVTYIAMNDDITEDYDEDPNVFVLTASFTDVCSHI